MIAKIRIAKNRRRPICSRGIMAFIMDLRTTCKPATKDRASSEDRFKACPAANLIAVLT